ncbi:hypothetical protein [Nonomuraea sp. GTA35]|uniref:hypothetical protein n=1 Tax=Nonomuraea sp. GTA35 TaxID=1676746 RepID=UPI0035C11478
MRGAGFRPFARRPATAIGIRGQVRNAGGAGRQVAPAWTKCPPGATRARRRVRARRTASVNFGRVHPRSSAIRWD